MSKKRKLVLYLSGPMSGKALYNFPAFESAAADLKRRGYVVRSPVDIDHDVWQKHFGRDFDPVTDKCDYGHPLLHEMMRGNVEAILASDAIAFLPGWEQSRGANFEKGIGEMLGLRMIDAHSGGDLAMESAVEEAQRLVHGNRGSDYGHPLDDFEKTAGMLNSLFRGRFYPYKELIAEDIGKIQICVKLSREENRPKRDNRVDIAGYAETIQMCADERQRRAPRQGLALVGAKPAA